MRSAVAGSLIALVAATILLARPTAGGALAQEGVPLAAPAPAPPVIGCSWVPDRSSQATLGGAVPDGDNAEDEGLIVVGSLPAPPNVDEEDDEILRSLAKITEDQAAAAAMSVVPEPQRRRVLEIELDVEQGYVVYDVEVGYRRGERGPDPVIEVVVDAGNGQALLMECEEEDDD